MGIVNARVEDIRTRPFPGALVKLVDVGAGLFVGDAAQAPRSIALHDSADGGIAVHFDILDLEEPSAGVVQGKEAVASLRDRTHIGMISKGVKGFLVQARGKALE